MKRKHTSLAISLEEIFDVDSIRSHPLPPMSATSSPPPEKPPDKEVQELLDWMDSLWAPEPIQDSSPGTQLVPRPFPWVTNTSGTKMHTIDYMLYTLNMNKISADFKCELCGDVEKVEHNLAFKYTQVADYIHKKGPKMGGIASNSWQFPTRPQCKNCDNKRRCLGEVITKDINSINWLFLFVGKLIGCCKVHQLRLFCEQNGIECSGTKPRLVYLTYIGLCKQLDPWANYDLLSLPVESQSRAVEEKLCSTIDWVPPGPSNN